MNINPADRHIHHAIEPKESADRDDDFDGEFDDALEATSEDSEEARRGSIPSTLDPDAVEAALEIGDLTDQLSDLPDSGVPEDMPPGGEEDLPEDELARSVEDAADAMPADTPADRADQSDQRDEIQPHFKH